MRKTLSAVLAAAALFGGAAISNGAANAYDRWDTPRYTVGTCDRQGVWDGVQYEVCKVTPQYAGASEREYAFAYGLTDEAKNNYWDITIHSTYASKDVIQIGRYGSLTEGAKELRNVNIEAKDAISGFYIDDNEFKTSTRINENAFAGKKLENVNISGSVFVGKNAFNGAYANVWKHSNSGDKGYIRVAEEGAFDTCTVSD